MVQERTSLLDYIQSHFSITSDQLLQDEELDANTGRFLTFLEGTTVVRNNNEFVPCKYSTAHFNSVTFSEFIDLLANSVRPSGAFTNGLGTFDLDGLGKQAPLSFQSDKLKGSMWAKLCNRLGRKAFAELILGVSGIFDAGAPQVSLKWQPFRKRQFTDNPFLLKRTGMYYLRREISRKYSLLKLGVDELFTAIMGRPVVPGRVPKKLRKLYKLLETAKRKEEFLDYTQMRIQIEKIRPLSPMVFENSTPISQVIRFLLIVLYRIFPPNTTFGAENSALIAKAVVSYLKYPRYERFDVSALAQSMKITEVPWLGKTDIITSIQDHALRMDILKKFLAYIFGYMVNNIVRTFWYITENSTLEGDANMFFPLRIWKALTRNWLNAYRDRFLEKIESVKSISELKPTQLQNLGILRLIPKKADVRPLCVPCTQLPPGLSSNFEGVKRIKFSQERIRPIRDILRFQQARFHKRYPESSVGSFSVESVGKSILEFRNHACKKAESTLPKVYGVQFDMRHCYDNLNQLKIIACIDELFSIDSAQEEYFVRNITSFSSNCGQYRRNFNIISTRTDIYSLDASRNEHMSSRKDVVSDSTRLTKYNKSDVLDLVRSQVIDPVVQIHEFSGQFYKRTRGVFQGFPLLATLCDIVYNSLVDKVIFCGLENRDYVFTRLADDFLFMSLHKEDCLKVFENANSGRAQKFGAFVNMEKVKFLDCNGPNVQSSTSFVGLEIDIKTLTVKRGPPPPIKIPKRYLASLKSSLECLTLTITRRLLSFLIDLNLVPIDAAINNLKNHLEPITACAIELFARFECENKQEMVNLYMYRVYHYVAQRWESLNGSSEFKRLYEFIEGVQRRVEAATTQ